MIFALFLRNISLVSRINYLLKIWLLNFIDFHLNSAHKSNSFEIKFITFFLIKTIIQKECNHHKISQEIAILNIERETV